VVVRTQAGEAVRFTAQPRLGLDQFPVNAPKYISQLEKSNLLTRIRKESNVDFLSIPAVEAPRGKWTGIDCTSGWNLTNPPPIAVSADISGDLPGTYWRFEAGESDHPLSLDFEFALFELKEESAKKRPIVGARYSGVLQFQTNEVAVIRLPPRRQLIEQHEKSFFLPARKKLVVETNDLLLIVEVDRTK